MDLLDELRRLLETPAPLIGKGDTVLAAVSGGPDSLAMLHALHRLQAEQYFAGLCAAHFHHGLRGADADADAAFVAVFCAERNIPCLVERGDIAADAARYHISIQQAARKARYTFLDRMATQSGAAVIATAHTRDDQIETVLLNILRGTGMDGLRGIPARRGRYIRPLRSVARAQVEEYCRAQDLTPRADLSNEDTTHYTRNRIRRELLPLLERDYHPGAGNSLLRLSQIAEDTSDFLRQQADSALTEATVEGNTDLCPLTLRTALLSAMHTALRREVFRLAIIHVRGTAEGITYQHFARLEQAVLQPRPVAFVEMLPAPSCRICVTAQTVTFSHSGSTDNGLWQEPTNIVPLPVPGEASLVEMGWKARAAWASSELPGGFAHSTLLDAACIDLNSLAVRGWRIGDRIDPAGMGGHTKKVQDIFTDAKVPRNERHRTLIVTDRHGLLWIAGWATAERARVQESTQRSLYLQTYAITPNDGRQ